MRKFIPNTAADKAVKELEVELEKGKDYPYINTPKEMAERLVHVGFGNILQFAQEAIERISAHKHKRIDPEEECPFSQTEEVDIWFVENELKKLAEEYTKIK